MSSGLDLQKFGIDPSVTTLPKNIDPAVKNLIKKYGRINEKISFLVGDMSGEMNEIKELREQIKLKTGKLTERIRELKKNQTAYGEQLMFLLGEQQAYINELGDVGVNIKKKDFTLIARQKTKELVEA